MLIEPDPIPLLPGEQDAGFSVLTLVYPDHYELPQLGEPGRVRHERAVAILIDDENRLRRTSSDCRYSHETFHGGCWITHQEFDSLSDLCDATIYQLYRP
jgi:hypothetical protein